MGNESEELKKMTPSIVKHGQAAWKRLTEDNNWHDWVQVGELVSAIRQEAMAKAETNEPRGKGYNLAFSDLLKNYKLDGMDQVTRKHLLDCMDNSIGIEAWRQSKSLEERQQWNHPSTVFRHYKKDMEPVVEKKKRPKLEEKHFEEVADEHEAALVRIDQLEQALSQALERLSQVTIDRDKWKSIALELTERFRKLNGGAVPDRGHAEIAMERKRNLSIRAGRGGSQGQG